jgi:hypothetical protein
MSAAEKFKAAKEIVNKARAEANQIVKEAFSEMAKSVFESNPDLKGFRWTQYTPYFNDGDTCTFSTNSDYPDLLHPKDEAHSYEDEDDDAEIGWIRDLYWYDEHKNLKSPLRKAYKDVQSFLGEFDDDDFLEMFGDHVRVTVTPEGVDVDEYDHD